MNKKINQLTDKTAVSTDLMLVGDPATGTSYKSTLSSLPLVPTSRTISINGVSFDLSANRSWTISTGTVTSVGLSMPSAFSVANSPITSSGTLAVTAIGTAAQYIRGDGQLATLPSNSSGGSSISYYLNGGTAASVSTYYQMSKIAIVGTAVDFTRLNSAGNGLIAQFLTDVSDPNRLEIPAGNWNFEMYFSASSNGGTPQFYVELLKYNGSTFTTIADNSTVPETITSGTITDLYITSLAIPQTTLLVTDRLAIRVYVITSGRDIVLHTQDSHLCEIITNFAGGITALNGLTTNTQYLATGTSGTDFNISSVTNTHTFNLPTASGTNRGVLSSADWTTFNGKFNLPSLTSGSILFSNGTTIAQDNAQLFWNSTTNLLGVGTATPLVSKLHLRYDSTVNRGLRLQDNNVTYDLITSGGGENGSFGIYSETAGAYRLYIRSGGNVIIGGSTDVGYKLDVNGTSRLNGKSTLIGSVTAASSLAQGVLISPTLVAAANNDVLVGMDITPTFTNGAFTGVTNLGLRVSGNTTIKASTGQTTLTLGGSQSASGSADGTISLISSLNNNLTISTYRNNFPTINSTDILRIQINATELVRIGNGNMIIQNGGTFTDAGYRLDVNGTSRIQDNLFVSKNQNATTSITISNTTSGTGAGTDFIATSDATSGSVQFGKYSSTKAAYKIVSSKDCYFYNNLTAGDISFLNDFTTGKIKFAAGGSSTAQATLTAASRLLIGTTTESTYILDVNGDTNINGKLNIGAGTSINAPIDLTVIGAVLKSSPIEGDIEVDSTGKLYYTHNTSERGLVDSFQFYKPNSTITLVSQTAAQKIFNGLTNGGVTLKAATNYLFECYLYITNMSSTSGSFGFAIGGTATYTTISWVSTASKPTGLTTANNAYTTHNISVTNNTAIVVSSSATAAWVLIKGQCTVNANGTFIPQISLGQASAAIIQPQSYFKITAISNNTTDYIGNWS